MPYTILGGSLLIVVVLLAIGVVVQYLQARRRRERFTAALEANQPEVAHALLRAGWHATALRGFILAGIGAWLLVVVCWRPIPLSGFLIPAVVWICAGVPMVVWALACKRSQGSPRAWPWVAAGGAALAAAALSYLVASRAHFPELPSPTETAAFSRRVERLIGAPVGSRSPVIDGHQAHYCLCGLAYGQQTCGSRHHPGLRFSTLKPGWLNVYYVPDLDSYLIIGTARVTPVGKTVTDGYITAREARRSPTGPQAP